MEADIDERMASQFEGAFLDASDIMAAKKDVLLTISDVVAPCMEKDATGKVIDKPIIAFKGAKKRMILNKTNAKVIAMMHGKKPSEWLGKEVTLTVRYLEKAFGQKNVPVIRVAPPSDKPLTFGMKSKYGSAVPFTNQ